MKLTQIRARALARQQHRSAHHFVRIRNRGLLWVDGHYLGKAVNFKVELQPSDTPEIAIAPRASFSIPITLTEVNRDNLRRALFGA